MAAEQTGLTASEIRRICGELLDWQVQAILASGATYEELEEAAVYASGADDVMGEERKPLMGRVAQLFDILTIDEEYGDETNHPR